MFPSPSGSGWSISPPSPRKKPIHWGRRRWQVNRHAPPATIQTGLYSLSLPSTVAAMQKMLSDSCALSLLQEASDFRRQSLVTETYRSMENLDRKFDKMLSLQVLDKSKAISHILQEVSSRNVSWCSLVAHCSAHCDSTCFLTGGDAEGSVSGPAAAERLRPQLHPLSGPCRLDQGFSLGAVGTQSWCGRVKSALQLCQSGIQ